MWWRSSHAESEPDDRKIAKPSDAECYTTHDCVNFGAFKLHTHCGVVSALVHGKRWMATPPLFNAERTGAPEGWANPFTAGTFRRLSRTKAEFVSDTGHTARFALAPAGWNPPDCD